MEYPTEMQKLDTAIVPLFKDPHIVDITFPYTKDFIPSNVPPIIRFKNISSARKVYFANKVTSCTLSEGVKK